MTQIQNLPIKDLATNSGQIQGVPKNPRRIAKEQTERLAKSILQDGELLKIRPLMVYPQEGKYIVIGGNARYLACKHLKMNDVPCAVIDSDTPTEQIRRYVLKDNSSFGDWDFDSLEEDWDFEELDDAGLHFDFDFKNDDETEYDAANDGHTQDAGNERAELKGMVSIALTDEEYEIYCEKKEKAQIKNDKKFILHLLTLI